MNRQTKKMTCLYIYIYIYIYYCSQSSSLIGTLKRINSCSVSEGVICSAIKLFGLGSIRSLRLCKSVTD
jgi:hypothetical protein